MARPLRIVEQTRSKLGKREEDANIPRVQQRGPAPKLGAIRRRYKDRNQAIRAAYQTGGYSYQQIAKEFGVHFTTVGRIVRESLKAERTKLIHE
jgi:DNA invertase Pin-like site-specific DNA recombinase